MVVASHVIQIRPIRIPPITSAVPRHRSSNISSSNTCNPTIPRHLPWLQGGRIEQHQHPLEIIIPTIMVSRLLPWSSTVRLILWKAWKAVTVNITKGTVAVAARTRLLTTAGGNHNRISSIPASRTLILIHLLAGIILRVAPTMDRPRHNT